MREEYYIKHDINDKKSDFRKSKTLFVLTLLGECGLSYLFKLFVISEGNLFDIILSSVVILFFLGVIIFQFFRTKKYKKELKSLQIEWDIATETPEERLIRERKEKFKRILQEETE